MLTYQDEGFTFIFTYHTKLQNSEIDTAANTLGKMRISSLEEDREQKLKVNIGEGISIAEKKVNIGDSLINCLQVLGNPNKDFYTEKRFYCNYFERGLDLVFENDFLTKIILHTNQFADTNFAFYDRCFFELDFEGTMISPLTRFSQIQKPPNPKHVYTNPNPNSQIKKTHVYRFERFLLEVLPEVDLISALTLF